MFRTFMSAKLHRGRVTDANFDYIGSITLDSDLMNAVGIAANEQVDVLNVSNGNRFTTYAIGGAPGSGVIGINGAAAHLASVGDIVIVVAYVHISESAVLSHTPRVAILDEFNRIQTMVDV